MKYIYQHIAEVNFSLLCSAQCDSCPDESKLYQHYYSSVWVLLGVKSQQKALVSAACSRSH